MHLFGQLPVDGPVRAALDALGYLLPTPIQEQAIPVLREGRDLLGQAQTGTGKTAGFGIPIVEAINVHRRTVQALVLVPTRELCLQVAEELTRLGRYARVIVLPVYGGVGLGQQTTALGRGVHVVVGTPGRVEDHLQRGTLALDHVRVAVLDEADRMLDVGFLPAIERILRRTPAARQTALFSATIPDEVRALARRHMRDPVTIAITPEHPAATLISQHFAQVPDGDKLSALTAYLDRSDCSLALVFRRTTYKADRLARDLTRGGYKVAALHGRRTQGQRERVLAQLKAGELQALVATDIAARGLDIAGLSHVFNYDLPDTPETYVHRIGRTGRAGESGVAVTLVGPEDADGLRFIQRYLARRAGDTPAAPGDGPKAAGADRNRAAATAAAPFDAVRRNPQPSPSGTSQRGQTPKSPQAHGSVPLSRSRRRRSRPRPAGTAP